ncbi:MAG: hypothetical protein ACKO19_03240 [Betaproteobacteria bacterium]
MDTLPPAPAHADVQAHSGPYRPLVLANHDQVLAGCACLGRMTVEQDPGAYCITGECWQVPLHPARGPAMRALRGAWMFSHRV